MDIESKFNCMRALHEKTRRGRAEGLGRKELSFVVQLKASKASSGPAIPTPLLGDLVQATYSLSFVGPSAHVDDNTCLVEKL